MRVVFIGAVQFSRHCLTEVLKNGAHVTAVFTLPSDQAARHADYADLRPIAARHAIPVHAVADINAPDTVELIRSLQPDVILALGWSRLVSKQILEIAPLGCIGSHPALLPRNRGRHPLIWALVEGLTESGLTFFYMDEGADSGDILWQRAFPITMDDDAASLYDRIERLATDAIAEFLFQLASGAAPRRPQDHSHASYWRKRTEADGRIRWAGTSVAIYNLVRALTRPYVGAHACRNDERVLIWRARLPRRPLPAAARGLEPGRVFEAPGEGLAVRSGDGHLLITEHESADGAGLAPGDALA